MVVSLSSCLSVIPEEFATNPNTAVVVSPLLVNEFREQDEIQEGDGDPHRWLTALRELTLLLNFSYWRYHNAQHAQSVCARMMLIQECAVVDFPPGNLWVPSTLGHDLRYSGSTYRQRLTGLECPELSNEEYACVLIDALFAKALSPANRLRMQGMILATSFRQRAEDGCPPDLVRPYGPHSPEERFLAFADVGSVAMGTAEDWLRDSVNLAAEKGAQTKRDYWQFVCSDGQNDFFNHVERHLNGLSSLIIRSALDDWQHNLTEHRGVLSEIRSAYQQTRWSLGLLRPRNRYLFDFVNTLIEDSVGGTRA